jgi:hypothetical protein
VSVNGTTGAETRAIAAFRAILEEVGSRAAEIGPRPVASQWPHRGSAYKPGGLLFAGQALDGWDAPDCSARWWAEEAQTHEGRERILDGTRKWHADRAEPLWGVLQFPWRRGSSFWTLCGEIVEALEPSEPEPWFSRLAWSNVYPLGHEKRPDLGLRSGSPRGALKEAQDPHVGDLFAAQVEMLDPGRILIVAGPHYWWEAERSMGLDLVRAPFPLIRMGRAAGRSWVVGYHPTYSRQAGGRHGPEAGTNAYYVNAVRRAFQELEGR